MREGKTCDVHTCGETCDVHTSSGEVGSPCHVMHTSGEGLKGTGP